MSLVYITHHDECIFDIDKTIISEVNYPRHYVSKYQKKRRAKERVPHITIAPDGKKVLSSSKKFSHATMGEAIVPLRGPCDFLKKHGGVKWSRLREHKCPPPRGMPLVPRCVRAEKPAEDGTERCEPAPERKHRLNFIKLNVQRAKKLQTQRPPRHYVDTPHGERHQLLPSGLLPINICRKNFGKVPPYLKKNNKMLAEVRAQCELEEQEALARIPKALVKYDLAALSSVEKIELNMVKRGLRKLLPEEHHQIAVGLKANYDKTLAAFMRMSLCVDTVAKKMRKGKIERQLRQLEQDMFLLSANPNIFVPEH